VKKALIFFICIFVGMKSISLCTMMLLMVFSMACNTKEDCSTPTKTAPASEVLALEAYLTSNGITATKDPHGFYYTINVPGGTSKPTICSTISVKYTGRLTNGSVFDSSTGATFALANLITGWQQGIPYIGKGGKITLYLPPSLGYGSQASGSIPANSILIFEIELI
jgi:FKBP-type peptidyl-prolyl cis-trans isomerase FkpA